MNAATPARERMATVAGSNVAGAVASSVPTSSAGSFDYDDAFSRNIGWFTASEQSRLRNARVAIAGLGGVGGAHLLTLLRLGIAQFNIADFDEFAVHNFNRQSGAYLHSVGQRKLDVMAQMGAGINSQADFRRFPQGVQPDNVDEFLRDVDVYVDGLDFFAMEARRMVFAACRTRGIPALTAAPLGMGVSFLYFTGDTSGLSFEDYFKLEGHDTDEQYARFIAGLSPAMLQRKYLVEPTAVNFQERRGPSTMMACDLCAGVMGTSVLKVLLGRGGLKPAPWAMQFDAYRQKLSFTWRPGGNSNPLQQLLLKLIRPRLLGLR